MATNLIDALGKLGKKFNHKFLPLKYQIIALGSLLALRQLGKIEESNYQSISAIEKRQQEIWTIPLNELREKGDYPSTQPAKKVTPSTGLSIIRNHKLKETYNPASPFGRKEEENTIKNILDEFMEEQRDKFFNRYGRIK